MKTVREKIFKGRKIVVSYKLGKPEYLTYSSRKYNARVFSKIVLW